MDDEHQIRKLLHLIETMYGLTQAVMTDFEVEVARLDLDHHPELELVALLDVVLPRDELVAVLPSIQVSHWNPLNPV